MRNEDGVKGINNSLKETHSSVINAIVPFHFSSLGKANLGLRAFNLLLYFDLIRFKFFVNLLDLIVSKYKLALAQTLTTVTCFAHQNSECPFWSKMMMVKT